MIEPIFYFFLLTIYFKLPLFTKYRKNTTFKFNFILVIISILVFLFTCFKIMTDPFYIFGFNLENMNLRKSALLIFISSFITLFAFTLSDYYKKEMKKKTAPSGDKGVRGYRGDMGKDKVCKPIECQKDICYKRMMAFLTKVYNNYLKSKGLLEKSGSAQFTNQFIINKIKLLCKSTQLASLIKTKGSAKAYLYVQDTWKKWLHIILKYEKGIEFLENDNFTDNDFDNLITENDKLYAEFENIDTPGTPSMGKESPFDEIKKFDMWYWGSTLKAMPKVIYKCDSDKKNVLKKVESNRYDNIWRSSNARQAYINRGKLENNNCNQKMKYVPFLRKGTKDISIYRADSLEVNDEIYKPLGDIALEGDIDKHFKTNVDEIQPRNSLLDDELKSKGSPKETTLLISGDVKDPLGFKKYESKRERGIGVGINGYSFWEPIPPKGYVCLGNVADNNNSISPPEKGVISCVPEKCVRKSKKNNVNLWNTRDSKSCLSECGCNNEYISGSKTDTDHNYEKELSMITNDNLFKIDEKISMN